MTHHVFRLMSDVQNPHYNRRFKTGYQTVKAFKVGTLVRASDIQPAKGEPYTSYQVGPDWFYASGELEEDIARQDPGVEMPIQTLEEAAVASYRGIDSFCREVLEQLIKEGRLYPAEAKELYDKKAEADGIDW